MRKASNEAVDIGNDEEGAANAAASLGPDGGPLMSEKVRYAKASSDFDEEDAWLEDELSDEELAALGEEDFVEELLAEALDMEGEAFDDTEDFSLESETPAVSEAVEPERARQSKVEPKAELKAEKKTPHETATGQALALAEDQSFEVSEFGDGEDDHRPVPRIAIHAFCETPDTTVLLERAAVDRRLSKTHLTVHMGGLAKAVDHFQSAATPNLVIIETLDGGQELFAQLGELAEVCDPSTKVIIIGRANDIGLYRELMRQGISDYIVRPRSPLQIIKSIATLYVDPSAPPIGRTIAFVGARGGSGSSTLAHNVAWCSAEEMQSDTVILDLDLPFGTASLDFEQDPTSGLIEALGSPERLDDVLLDRLLQKHTDHLSLFTAPNLLDRDYDVDDQAYETVIDVVRGAAPTIIIDVPHVWTGWSKRLLQTADQIVITATADLAAFRNTKNLVDIISSARPNDAPPLLVINQFDQKLSSVQPAQYAEHVGLKPSIVFNWEPQLFHTAATNASPIVEVGAKTKTAQSIRDLTALVLGRTQTASKKTRFSLAGLLKKK
ncbi:MAG TPA: pilus assembly protein CpaE [Parvularculaceae bacterium]|nr:pilus assembly protein CpaE [Parvularculaceae bacterium]